ncbi:MAG: sigma 54-interacting transcriptional regulator [Methylococcales bacterium]|nr:sigma 54-interacting transcriptional regulator [Methylococcales bacterium]
MNQTRTIPDQCDWVRQDVSDSWRRCLEDFHLPLGRYSNWSHYNLQFQNAGDDSGSQNITRLIKHLNNNFDFFLKEAGVMLLLTRSDGTLLYTLGDPPFSCPFIERLLQIDASWSETVVGNNGIGSAIHLKKPIAFQGMEHFLSALHPFTTVGYPILDDTGEIQAVIGLISDHLERMNSLFAFLHLICVLVNTNLPLAHSQAAQSRVLEKIPLKSARKLYPQHDAAIEGELKALVEKAVRLQHYKIPILITGESGVGKDHFVHLLKKAGPRQNQVLIAINCASIPHDLIESELFGYEAGSFTGAKSNGKPGKFLLADNGILFLDEIGDMSLDLQSTLLRVLETSEFTPVGGSKPIRVDVQIVAATNVNLLNAVESGRFRRDLYYRLNGAQIHLQPLRERSDKKQIIHQILQRELNKLQTPQAISFAPDVLELIEQHPWPGNIRQLINVLRATIYTADSSLITRNDLPLDFIGELDTISAAMTASADKKQPSDMQRPHQNQSLSLLDWEKYGIKTTLLECEGNISIAAKKLGITRTTLYKKIDRFGLNKTGNPI